MPDPHVITVEEVVARIQRVRKDRDLSQEELARRAGVSRSCVQHMEKGRTTPTLLSLLKITTALKLSLPTVLRAALTAPPGRSRARRKSDRG